jgi:uncharacterized protein YaaW (UPF0174 family)
MGTKLDVSLGEWTEEEIGNLCVLLGAAQPYTTEQVMNRFKWLYHSRGTAGVESTARNITGKLLARITKAESPAPIDADDLREMPTYDELLHGACRHVKVFEKNASQGEHELYLSHAVIIAALQHMNPKQRVIFFDQQVDVRKMLHEARIPGTMLGGPIHTMVLLGAAQASGFGVYVASTTALGFLTHAVGVTLPFAVYTGLSSTIAFAIGPAGWLAAGLWATWKLTQPNWRKIIPGLVFMISTNSHRKQTTAIQQSHAAGRAERGG